jgi:lysozyme
MGNRAKLSATVLGLVLAGASAPTILDQFLNEKEGNSLTAYKDGGGIWTICRGATMVDGKPVVQGMKLTQAKCDQVNAIERDKALAWVERNIHVPLSAPQKAGIASFAPITSGRENVSLPLSISASMPVTGKGPVNLSAGGLKTVGVIAA